MTAGGESTYFALLCPSYHGATMLSALLSNHSQICSAGDGNPGWRDPNRIPCKCGRSIAVCDFWQGLAGLRETGGKPANELWFPTTPKIIAGCAAGNLRLAKALAFSSFKLKRNLMGRLFPPAARRFTWSSVMRGARHNPRSNSAGSCAKHCKPNKGWSSWH